MGQSEQLRQYARDCLRLSQEMTSPELKIHLINMAEAWAALAVQSERIAAICDNVTADSVPIQPDPPPAPPGAEPIAVQPPDLLPPQATGPPADQEASPPAENPDPG